MTSTAKQNGEPYAMYGNGEPNAMYEPYSMYTLCGWR